MTVLYLLFEFNIKLNNIYLDKIVRKNKIETNCESFLEDSFMNFVLENTFVTFLLVLMKVYSVQFKQHLLYNNDICICSCLRKFLY